MSIIIRGKEFSNQDIELIKKIVHDNFEEGRTRASIEICKKLNWVQENGWLKERACRDALLKLEARGYLALPPRKAMGAKASINNASVSRNFSLDKTDTDKLELNKISCELVKGTKQEALWNYLVKKYHYLSFSCFVGRSLKYLFTYEGVPIGAIGWCDPAWSISCRDNFLQSINILTIDARRLIVNNGRFLILPWVKVPNLASYLLAISSDKLIKDWHSYYNLSPMMLETFVDPEKFEGTCYKAANWIYLGDSRGFYKKGNRHSNSQQPKKLFVYPATTRLRKKLLNYVGGIDVTASK